jgi:hypothetical protein
VTGTPAMASEAISAVGDAVDILSPAMVVIWALTRPRVLDLLLRGLGEGGHVDASDRLTTMPATGRKPSTVQEISVNFAPGLSFRCVC